jgi:hypothetical protein
MAGSGVAGMVVAAEAAPQIPAVPSSTREFPWGRAFQFPALFGSTLRPALPSLRADRQLRQLSWISEQRCHETPIVVAKVRGKG